MIEKSGNEYFVVGKVTMDNAHAVLDESDTVFLDPAIVVNFSRVKEADSAILSLMLEWLRRAKTRSQTLTFVNIPANVKSLATLYGVLEFIAP